MDVSIDPYRYRSLSGDQIRLLHLSAGLYDDELIATLEHVDLNQHPKYEALSYTWGTSFKDCYVNCRTDTGVKKIAITKNLEDALRRLRSVEQTRVLWIDQVCINQDDVKERSSQVPRMGLIYASAFQVCIWIGKEDDDARLAFGNFLPFMLSKLPSSQLFSDIRDDAQYVLPGHALLIARSEGWEALARTFDRPWFRRVWVIQETVMAARALVYCGNFIIAWDDLARACRCQIRQQSLRQGHNALESIDNTRWQRTRGGNDIYDILFMSYRFQCTDPRDKIYAVVGLANHHKQEEGLVVDYESGVEEIYLRSAVSIMLSNRSLDLLQCVVNHTIISSLPSWAPDWRSEPLIQSMLKEQSPKPDQSRRGDPATQFYISDDRSALTITGKHIGSISELGMTMSYSNREDSLQQWREMAERTGRSGTDTYPSNFLQTLIAATRTDDDSEPLYNAWNNVWERLRGVGYQDPRSSAEENQKAFEFDGRMLETCIGRRMVVIDDRAVGLGPSESDRGDLVCCFEDTKNPLIPFVVRAKGEAYTLIGQGFVPGLSSPWSWSQTRLSRESKHQFVLR